MKIPFIASKNNNAKQHPHSTGGGRIYAVGDIHGMHNHLIRIIAQIENHLEVYPTDDYQCVFLGDYVDRGPDSQQVIESLIHLSDRHPVTCLMGNHEWSLLQYIDGYMPYQTWVRWGADTTLESYGVHIERKQHYEIHQEFKAAFPSSHQTFMRALPFYHEIGDYIFVHAGLRPKVPLEKQDPHDLMMIREEFIDSSVTTKRCIIHGHTIFPQPHIRRNSIGVDTGVYMEDGKLTAIILEGSDYSFLHT